MAKSLYGFACLTVALAGFPVISALAQQQPKLSHPAEIAGSPQQADQQSALDLHVPLLNRIAPQPSYGPAAETGAQPATSDVSQQMDHSAHQMPGMTSQSNDGEGVQ